jgi:hypothetical protein
VLCIEQGYVCIIINLDDIYQTFYDLLNQNYTEVGGRRFCRIAFGSDSSRIEVHPNFKFILV